MWHEIHSFLNLQSLLLTLFFLCLLVQLYFQVRYFIPFALQLKETDLSNEEIPLSVIIAAKNEAKGIVNTLESIIQQDYENFELILIDDHSADETVPLAKALNFPQLKIFSMPANQQGKKAAIQFGISQAKYEYLVFTDADCLAKSPKWLKHIASHLKNNQLVLGHSPFIKESGLLNQLARFENTQTALFYFSFAKQHKPYMGVGRNMAYHKGILSDELQLWNEEIKSGDDDLIVNRLGKKYKTAICTHVDSHTISRAETSWRSYFNQKRRQLQAGSYYAFSDKFRLYVVNLSKLYGWWLFIVLLSLQIQVSLILSIFVAMQMIQILVGIKSSKHLENRDLAWKWPLLEVVHLHWIGLVAFSSLIWKVDKWK